MNSGKFWRKIRLLLAAAAIASVLFGCSSLQEDEYRSTMEIEFVRRATEAYEKALVTLDAEVFFGGMSEERKSRLKEFVLDADAQMGHGKDSGFEARMSALKGRAEFLLGNVSRAKKLHSAAVSAQKGDTQAAVLAVRLGLLDVDSAEALADDARPFLAERGLALYGQENFRECVAAFDAAFRELPDFYREAYKPVRDSAWSMKDFSGERKSRELLKKQKISPADMISIARDETQILSPWLAGGGEKMGELQRRLASDGIIEEKVLEREHARRVDCARFLWAIYSRRRKIFADYAAEFAAAGIGQSPIGDVPLDDAHFSDVAGVVENEIMSLVDGINFEPENTVSGAEFALWARKAEE